MFWLKLKKALGLIRTKKYEEIVLFNKIRNSGMFDEQYYLHKYPDVKQAKSHPIHHYITHGWREIRQHILITMRTCRTIQTSHLQTFVHWCTI